MKKIILEIEPGPKLDLPEYTVQAYLPHYRSWFTLTYSDDLDNSYANAAHISEKYRVRTRIFESEHSISDQKLASNRRLFGATDDYMFWERNTYRSIPTTVEPKQLKRQTSVVEEHARLEDIG